MGIMGRGIPVETAAPTPEAAASQPGRGIPVETAAPTPEAAASQPWARDLLKCQLSPSDQSLPSVQIGMTDGDYLAAFLHVLLPVAFEFQPQLVLVAAGFDSVTGDPKVRIRPVSRPPPPCFSFDAL
uniref:Histone deacetylase domain-containing protein n=1 Tax=Sphenodon punctatus TaxID=8508 RepID=A0A8D0GN82_SPHPU